MFGVVSDQRQVVNQGGCGDEHVSDRDGVDLTGEINLMIEVSRVPSGPGFFSSPKNPGPDGTRLTKLRP